jgi:hypothetical protein
MKLLKLKLFVLALIMFGASSAFASLSYSVSVDTSSLSSYAGYLYLQYIPVDASDSTATVSNFSTDGVLYASSSANVVNGAAVNGQLPGSVVFTNTNGINDYNHGITFGNKFNFLLTLGSPSSGGMSGGGSTFSLGLFQDENGFASLLGGTLFTITLMNDGSATTQILAKEANVVTPIPPTALLLGSGLLGLAGLKQRIFG